MGAAAYRRVVFPPIADNSPSHRELSHAKALSLRNTFARATPDGQEFGAPVGSSSCPSGGGGIWKAVNGRANSFVAGENENDRSALEEHKPQNQFLPTLWPGAVTANLPPNPHPSPTQPSPAQQLSRSQDVMCVAGEKSVHCLPQYQASPKYQEQRTPQGPLQHQYQSQHHDQYQLQHQGQPQPQAHREEAHREEVEEMEKLIVREERNRLLSKLQVGEVDLELYSCHQFIVSNSINDSALMEYCETFSDLHCIPNKVHYTTS